MPSYDNARISFFCLKPVVTHVFDIKAMENILKGSLKRFMSAHKSTSFWIDKVVNSFANFRCVSEFVFCCVPYRDNKGQFPKQHHTLVNLRLLTDNRCLIFVPAKVL